MQLFKKSDQEKANDYDKQETTRISDQFDVDCHIAELTAQLDERGIRALAALLSLATKNKYSGSAIMGGWLLTFKDGIAMVEKPQDPYQ